MFSGDIHAHTDVCVCGCGSVTCLPNCDTHMHTCMQSETDPLHKIEKMLLKVQQARRDLEEQAVLAEIQAGWKDIIPPPTADL